MLYEVITKSVFSVDALGITVTAGDIGTKDAGLIIQRPQVINKPGHIMDNVDYWQEMCGVYRARGDEKYLTIGNFWDNNNTSYKQNKRESTDSAFYYAYYYIDDVRVFEIENTFECGCTNDFSFGSDWMADDYDPETGYNSLALNAADKAGDNNGNLSENGINNGNNSNLNNSGLNGANGINTDDSLNNINGAANDYGNSLLINMKESEISQKAFENAQIGSKFNLNRIFFEFNSSELLTASYAELDKLSGILKDKPGLRIEIRRNNFV